MSKIFKLRSVEDFVTDLSKDGLGIKYSKILESAMQQIKDEILVGGFD